MPKRPKLTDVAGIGEKMEEKLREAGFTNPLKLARMNPAKLASKVSGLGQKGAEKIIASAKKLLPDETKRPDAEKKTGVKKKGKGTPKKKEKEPKKRARKKSDSMVSKKSPKKPTERIEATKEMLFELEIEINSEDEQVALGAVERLGKIDDKQATDILIDGLKDPRYMVRIHVAAQLGDKKGKASTDALIEALNDDDSVFVRQTAAGALESIGGKKAKQAVKQAEEEGRLFGELPEGKKLVDDV